MIVKYVGSPRGPKLHKILYEICKNSRISGRLQLVLLGFPYVFKITYNFSHLICMLLNVVLVSGIFLQNQLLKDFKILGACTRFLQSFRPLGPALVIPNLVPIVNNFTLSMAISFSSSPSPISSDGTRILIKPPLIETSLA